MSTVDDLLIYITLPCIFLFYFLRLAPAVLRGEGLIIAVSVLQVLQVGIALVAGCQYPSHRYCLFGNIRYGLSLDTVRE